MFDSYAEIFAERGGAYHAAMAACPQARDAEFRAVLEPLSGLTDGLLCDMPAGGGYLGRYLRPGLGYIGVDPASDFCLAFPNGLDRLQASISDVPLADGSVDYIVSLAALHHEPDLPAVFAEMRRLLRPGGRLVIADAAAGTAPAVFLNGFVDRHNPMGHNGRFLDESTSRLLAEAGFVIADDRLVEMRWNFASREQAGEFCRSLFWMPGLTADEVAEAMDREIGFADEGGSISLRWVLRRIVCDAT